METEALLNALHVKDVMYFRHLFETYRRSGKQNSRYRTYPSRFTSHVCVCVYIRLLLNAPETQQFLYH